jgi:hypothetical protein
MMADWRFDMRITTDREERKLQRHLLINAFPNYLPIHHDAFVLEYNRITEKKNLAEYMKNRGITDDTNSSA